MDLSEAPVPNEPRKSFWTVGRIVVTLIGVALIAALGLSSCNSTDKSGNPTVKVVPGTSNASPESPTNNPPLAAFINLPPEVRDLKVTTLDGGSLKLSDYNDKVVIVNIWATWCGPCREEMPELVKFYSEFKSRGLVVLGLATTYNESDDMTHVKDYVASHKIDYKIIWDDGTMSLPLLKAVHAQSVIPQSFVIARDGRIVKHFQGFNALSTPQMMRMAIEDALNEKEKA
jgi:thiol-disulfide isomerase/thioredoxin